MWAKHGLGLIKTSHKAYHHVAEQRPSVNMAVYGRVAIVLVQAHLIWKAWVLQVAVVFINDALPHIFLYDYTFIAIEPLCTG